MGNSLPAPCPCLASTVHPHTRGEQPGQLSLDTQRLPFIPTHVGNSPHDTHGKGQCTVHPHTRGEQPACALPVPGVDGSSPHTWGTVLLRYRNMICRWFIPTHVGNRTPQYCCHVFRRFIPTHVGNSAIFPFLSSSSSVHPHTRGEQFMRFVFSKIYCGSSPHTWGTDQIANPVFMRLRFIPTHVGNRLSRKSGKVKVTVHPHTRGEQSCCQNASGSAGGSSPHTWGTDQIANPVFMRLRFIPTHVGNRLSRKSGKVKVTVHPHTRGEQSCCQNASGSAGGSSPHTWGTVGSLVTAR